MAEGSMPDRSTSARWTCASSSTECVVDRPPLRRPNGVRTASTTTTSVTVPPGCLPAAGDRCCDVTGARQGERASLLPPRAQLRRLLVPDVGGARRGLARDAHRRLVGVDADRGAAFARPVLLGA